MTCQTQAEGTSRAVVPFADGAKVRHKLHKGEGVVQTRTHEEPPRYVVMAQGGGEVFESLCRHHELEALDVVAPERPGMMTLPKGAMLTVPSPFTFLRNPETFADFLGIQMPLLSKPFGSPTHYPKPVDPRATIKNDVAPGPQVIRWEKHNGGLVGYLAGAMRFTVLGIVLSGDNSKPWTAKDHSNQEISPTFATQREAQDWCAMRTNPDAKGTIYFSGEDGNGQHLSDCRRFIVTRFRDRYQAEDTRDKVYSRRCATMQEAFKWCLDRRRGEGNVNEPTPKIENVPGLEWGEIEPGAWLYDKSRRFRIDMANTGPQALRCATDLHMNTEDERRYSPAGTTDEVKEWCEDRAAATKRAAAKKAEEPKPAGKLV